MPRTQTSRGEEESCEHGEARPRKANQEERTGSKLRKHGDEVNFGHERTNNSKSTLAA
ncbi:hypothetical protein RBWH47_00811 [Rhodopirellula baltica WH47]|uniref:Uncharacterized protein n=1 Tax=Rhodopirellula baltica WH47 TaxID=991778 RepID=F2AKD6_RHOBT|nr:hypothetical protein RBWH47_00811 [Rhodopirellula baltica WH47]